MSAEPNLEPNFYPVLLAGGSGTRFWPRSRRARAKQVLSLDGEQSMVQQTVERLLPLADRKHIWVITSCHLAETLAEQLSDLPPSQILAEPVSRNTAPAAGLAAFLLERENPDAVLGMFPADHVIGDVAAFQSTVDRAVALAAAGPNIVVLGVKPTRAETGYGYIETGAAAENGVLHVRRFTEKPNQTRAEEFIAEKNFYWNSGMFFWKAKTLADALREHLSETAPYLEQIAAAYGTPQFESVFAELYPQCENISLDYAVLEPRSTKGEHRSRLYCIPAAFGWNDLGSWAALYEHHRNSGPEGANILQGDEEEGHYAWQSRGNYVYAANKFIALIGVDDLVVVDTGDALLITTRKSSQEVGRIVKYLTAQNREELL